MIPYNQLSLADIFSDCQEIYESDKPQFLSLLQQHIDLDEIVPASFRKHFYASTGRTRKYLLYAFLWALIIQRVFSIPTDLGDAAFDSAKLYKELLSGDTFGRGADGNGIHFQKACIPLNSRSGLGNNDYSVNEQEIPCCSNAPSLPMKHEGTSKRKNGIVRYKFICPKVKWEKNPSTGKYHRVCHCDTPCSFALEYSILSHLSWVARVAKSISCWANLLPILLQRRCFI